MSRYHDTENLEEMIQAKADTLIEGKEAFLYVAKWLELLPPADVRPMVHAHWIKRGNEKICSAPKCNFIYYSNNDDFNYCPNCGAVMDGKE